jgi:hypothetical protein
MQLTARYISTMKAAWNTKFKTNCLATLKILEKLSITTGSSLFLNVLLQKPARFQLF